MEPERLGMLYIDDAKRKDLYERRVWITREGREVKVSEMEPGHLINAVMVIQPFKHEEYFRKWRKTLMKEFRKRNKQKQKTWKKKRA